MSSKLQVLCLHGSQQDGEIFSQRIDSLKKKLCDMADLHFLDAPHELPLQEGQTVPMRAWWRHPGISPTCNAANGVAPGHVALFDNRMVPDWHSSLKHLQDAWTKHGGFDAVIGFSNGAAAAFLLICHVMGQAGAPWPGRRLKCAVLASGYVPEPLEQLLPEGVAVQKMAQEAGEAQERAGDEEDTSSGEPLPLVSQLEVPLKLASLHLYSTSDKAVHADQSRALARQFEQSRRQHLEHDLAHCVPQKAHHCETILDFLSWFEPDPAYQPTVTAPLPAAEQPAASDLASGDAEAAGAGQVQAEVQQVEIGVSGIQLQGEPASPEQLEEMEALQAIYDAAYRLLQHSPAKFCISLKDPCLCTAEQATGSLGMDEESGETGGPPSSHFSLVFTLPKEYPAAGSPPSIQVFGPLLNKDPIMLALTQHLIQAAEQEMEATQSGCCYQVVEAAKEWLDSQLPADFPAGQSGGQDAAAESEGLPWWEAEEADEALIKEAIRQASLTHWSLFYGRHGLDEGEVEQAHPHPHHHHHSSASGGAEDSFGSVGGGRWDFTVGLVGKPSAGKSSLFNALTCALQDGAGAKVAAQPFTTIAPNIGRGWALVPDPCRAAGLQPEDCKPTHGFVPAFDLKRVDPAYANIGPLTRWLAQAPWGAAAEWRRVPITIKDVAGLVPGAYAGRGRGNAFLNDLCDADVLIHVVDASGSTDTEGRPAHPGEGANPIDDIGWVREEIHRWVYDNVRTKWGVVRRKPTRLPDMLTGYHVPRAMVLQILERVGLPASVLTSDNAAPLLSSWGEADLHKLVATFLAARFPILLALNKADLGAAQANIQQVREFLPHEPAVPTSAASERWLAAAAQEGTVIYQMASDHAEPAPGCTDATISKRAVEISKRVLSQYGSTGALLAVTVAMAMRPPRVVFPVSDCLTCTALPCKGIASGTGVLMGSDDAKARAAEGSNPSVLRDVVLLKPGSTPADAFMVLKKPPWQLLEGEYVRAEARVLEACPGSEAAGHHVEHKQVLKKDDLLTWNNCVLRCMVNKKNSGWQK